MDTKQKKIDELITLARGLPKKEISRWIDALVYLHFCEGGLSQILKLYPRPFLVTVAAIVRGAVVWWQYKLAI